MTSPQRARTVAADEVATTAVNGAEDPSRDWQIFRQLLTVKHADDGLGRVDASLSTEAVFSAIRLVTRWQNDFELLHRPHGLTWAGFRVLNVLWVSGTSEVREIARHLGVARPSVSSALTTLEQAGLVRRIRSETDRRLVFVEMTPEGLTAFHDAVERQADQQLRWLEVLDKSEQNTLVELLNRVLDQPAPAPRVNESPAKRRRGK